MLEILRNKLGTKKYILIFFTLFIIIESIMVFMLKDINMTEFIEMQVTTSKDKFIEILNGWNKSQIQAYHNHFYIDFLYLISYSLLLFSIISFYFNKAGVKSRGTFFLITPFLIALFDIIENIFHLYFITVNYEMPKIFVMLSGMFSIQKWVLVIVILYVIILSFFKLTIIHEK